MDDLSKMDTAELESAVSYHNGKYWVENAPEISDPEFDRLVEELRRRKSDSPVLLAIGPAGALAGGDGEVESREKIEHLRPMLSLDKCYSEGELSRWFARFEGDALVSPKIDGVAAALRYDRGGRLVLATTRGDGRVGEAITNNIRQVGGVPESIGRGPLEVRGEVYMPLSVFRSSYAEHFANPRNLTAGAIKQKDPKKTGQYRIRFMAYDLDLMETQGPLEEVELARSSDPIFARGGELPDTLKELEVADELGKRALLKELGFTPVPARLVDAERANLEVQRFVQERNELDYETDGIVFKVNRLDEQARMGETSHHPRYAMAYKYQGEAGSSVLLEVEWSVSRTGAINPVAIVEPITLSGVQVSRASLHNLAIMKKLGGEEGLRLGSRLLMVRRGGVIPHVELVEEPGQQAIEVPSACPSCGGETNVEDEVLYAAHKPSCAGTRLGALQHYLKTLGIKGFGPKVLSQLIERELLSEPADLYRLTVEDLTSLERVGGRLATRLIKELEERKNLSLEGLLSSLGINGVGPQVARLVVPHFTSLMALKTASLEALSAIHGIGPVTGSALVEALEERWDEIERLQEHLSIEITQIGENSAADDARSLPLSGKSILFTGKLEALERKQAQARVSELGGETPSSVNRDLTHLVLGDSDFERFRTGWRSVKLKRVEELNAKGSSIAIISESDFREMIA